MILIYLIKWVVQEKNKEFNLRRIYMNFKEKIFAFMKEEAYKPLTFQELLKVFEIDGKMKKELLIALNELEDEGKIIFTRTERYGVPEKMNLITSIDLMFFNYHSK